jgi:aspartate carbamoyltransferase regulatory subunit
LTLPLSYVINYITKGRGFQMTIYVKRSGEEYFYFTDGVNELSKDYTYKQMVKQAIFLESMGITVEILI